MRQLSNRVDRLEGDGGERAPILVHVMPGRTTKQALASYERTRGKIPEDAKVVFIKHTFTSAL